MAYPQWQGSGRNENLLRGANATAEVCAKFASLRRVPLATDQADRHGISRWVPIFEQFKSAQNLLNQHAATRILTAGGDCAVDIAVIDYLIGQYPDLTVIWIDSHFDANTSSSSPSGNFHGMPVAAIMGEAPAEMQALLKNRLTPEKFRYVWANVADEGDRAFQVQNNLKWLGDDEHIPGPIHIHFDLDVLDPSEFPFLAYPEANGMAVAAAIALVKRLAAQSEIVGFTVTEFAPANGLEAQTGAQTIAALCAAACGQKEQGI